MRDVLVPLAGRIRLSLLLTRMSSIVFFVIEILEGIAQTTSLATFRLHKAHNFQAAEVGKRWWLRA